MILLPEIGASCIEQPPIWAFGATTLKEEATGLVFAAIFNGEFFRKDKKKKKSPELFLKLLKFWT